MKLSRIGLLGLLPISIASAAPGWFSVSNADLAKLSPELAPMERVQVNENLSLVKMDQKQVHDLSHLMHTKLKKCGGFFAQPGLNEAKSILENTLEDEGTLRLFADYSIDQKDLVQTLMDQVDEFRIRSMISELQAYQTRNAYTKDGVDSTLFIRDRWQEITSHRSDVKIELVKHEKEKFEQPSIILTIEGSELPNEIVVLGGHADSLAQDHDSEGKGLNQRSPGADDNASGIASVTEVLRIMMENNIKPKRTIQFMAYAAEEYGLIGSNDIARKYRAAKRNVVGVLQLDMTLFKGSSTKDIAIINDYTNKAQNEFMARLIDEYVQVPWGYSQCGYGCSDHASWTLAGYPSSFTFEAMFEDYNQNIHTRHDTIENAGGSAEHSVKFTKLAAAFLVELAN